MRNAAFIFVGCGLIVMGLAPVASAQSAYSVRNESMSTGGTTGKSPNFRATTLMAEPAGTDGTSPNFGIDVVIPETIEEEPTAVHPKQRPSQHFSLDQNYPNPFNPVTKIRFELPAASRVRLEIYDVTGRLVKTLVNKSSMPAGQYETSWNGKNNNGQSVSSGIYFYKMEADRFQKVRKMVLIK